MCQKAGDWMYCFESVVRYSELDADGRMSLTAILNLLQDCCTFQSEEIGIGVAFLQRERRAWVLSSWQVVVNRYPGMGEKLYSYTWPYGFKGFLGFRNFKIEDGKGETVAYANSIWTYLDTEKKIPVKVPKEVKERYVFEPPYEMECAGRKIRIEEGMLPGEPVRAGRLYLDTNRHVNNGKYVAIAAECLPEGFKARQLRAEYKMEAHLSDMIYPKSKAFGNRVLVSLENSEQKPYAVVEFWEENV